MAALPEARLRKVAGGDYIDAKPDEWCPQEERRETVVDGCH
jgi:hypothetical protein